MRLNAYIHRQHAFSLQADPMQPPGIIEVGPALKWASSKWDGNETHTDIVQWLCGLLPEKKKREQWISEAQDYMDGQGSLAPIRTPETELWFHSTAEFTGAVELMADDGLLSIPNPISTYQTLSESDILGLLSLEGWLWSKGRKRRPIDIPKSSLSGVCNKISITALDGGGWAVGGVGQLNTWIVKHEKYSRLPGEAGVESVCLNALRGLGISAVKAYSRMVGDKQCVFSERSDRTVVGRKVVPIHQEDFRQASGAGAVKSRSKAFPEKEWPDVYALLPEEEHEGFTQLLAVTWLIGHSHFHRGNIGFQISHPDSGPKRINLAPAYDFSSAISTKVGRRMEFPIGGQVHPDLIGIKQWREHAAECQCDPEITMACVADVAQKLPDALMDAMKKCKHTDENSEQADVNRRCERIVEKVVKRGHIFKAR